METNSKEGAILKKHDQLNFLASDSGKQSNSFYKICISLDLALLYLSFLRFQLEEVKA